MFSLSHTLTHTAVLRPFVQHYPGGQVLEETFTHSHVKRVVETCRHHSGFYDIDNLAGCHPIDAPTSIIPPQKNFILR